MNYGHGAAAVLLGQGRVKAEIIAVSSIHDDLVDQYRSRKNRFDYTLEERWVREEGWLKTVPQVIENVLNDAAISTENLDKIIVMVQVNIALYCEKIRNFSGKGRK